MTVSTFLTTALSGIRMTDANQADAADLDFALTIFNELLDSLNADKRAVYNSVMQTFTLTPSLNPHTIGVAANSPTWSVTTNRPETIEHANLVISSDVHIPLTLRDDAWWANQRVPSVTSAIPTDLNYRATWPNGSIYLWPVPSSAYSLQLDYRTVLAQVALTDTFTLPPGYQQALRLTLQELLAGPFGVVLAPEVVAQAREARARVWAANDEIPRWHNDAAGFGRRAAGRTGWTYLTGGF